MRRAGISISVALILFLVIVIAIQSSNSGSTSHITQTSPLSAGGQAMLPTKTITVGSVPLTVEVASTAIQKQNGLSGRSGLADGTGMLFVFDPASVEGFWMKDMQFSLDILWADANGEIITIDPDLAPSTYPNVFRPSAPAKYVLEVPAGFTKQKGIAVGQKLVVQ